MTISEQLAQLQSHSRYTSAIMRPFRFGHLITLPNFVLPVGWSYSSTTALFYIDSGYPCARPRGFWTTDHLRYVKNDLYGDCVPQNTTARDYESPPEAAQRWFWTPTHWSANGDTLLTFAHVIRMRFVALR